MQNRITEHFKHQDRDTLNVFCTAGYPGVEDTMTVLESLQSAGVDMIEIGMPFSDPTADGETIQYSNKIALDGGMTIPLLFRQLQDMRPKITIPVILMGYLNPALQYGFERFLDDCVAVGIDGLILPDLPIREYENLYKAAFEARNLSNIFLITPQTSEERIRVIDQLSEGFVYAVSTFATTGGSGAFGAEQIAYFKRLQAMKLRNPILIGFGISDRRGYETACSYGAGAIIGSAYIKALKETRDVRGKTIEFVKSIRE